MSAQTTIQGTSESPPRTSAVLGEQLAGLVDRSPFTDLSVRVEWVRTFGANAALILAVLTRLQSAFGVDRPIPLTQVELAALTGLSNDEQRTGISRLTVGGRITVRRNLPHGVRGFVVIPETPSPAPS